MATVTIPDPTYQRLKEMAAAAQMPVDEYLARVLDQGQNKHSMPAAVRNDQGSPEWQKLLREWIESSAVHGITADDSRDAIYGDEPD